MLNKTFKKIDLYYVAIFIIFILSGFLRYDALVSTHKRLPINGNYNREGTAISLYKNYGFKVYPIPNYRLKGILVDPEEYLRNVKDIDADKLEPYYLNPGPPVLLAITYKLFGLKYIYYQSVQLFITWIQLLLVYYIGCKVFSSRLSGLIAAALYSISPYEMNYSLYIGREIQVPSALLASIAGVVYLAENKNSVSFSRKNILIAIAMGVWVGICTLFKKPSLFWLMLVPIAILPFVNIKKLIVFTVVSLISCSVILFPWMYRNKLVTGRFSLSSYSGGLSFWAGIGANANPLGQTYTDSVGLASTRMYLKLEGKKTMQFYQGGGPDYAKMAVKKSVQYMKVNPSSFYKGFVNNIKVNLTKFTQWPYYDFWYAAIPDYNITKGIFGNTIYEKLRNTWKYLITILPYLSLIGLALAFIDTPKTYILWIYLTGAVISLSMMLSGHCKYSYHILTIHYLGSGYFFYILKNSTIQTVKKLKTIF